MFGKRNSGKQAAAAAGRRNSSSTVLENDVRKVRQQLLQTESMLREKAEEAERLKRQLVIAQSADTVAAERDAKDAEIASLKFKLDNYKGEQDVIDGLQLQISSRENTNQVCPLEAMADSPLFHPPYFTPVAK